jgi:hypothetical protein
LVGSFSGGTGVPFVSGTAFSLRGLPPT